MQMMLCHEQPGAHDRERYATGFDTFFVCEQGATPRRLVAAGIYRAIALPMEGGVLREVSLAIVVEVVAAIKVAACTHGT